MDSVKVETNCFHVGLFRTLLMGKELVNLQTILFPNVFLVHLKLPCASIVVYFTVIEVSPSSHTWSPEKHCPGPSSGEVWHIMHEVVYEQGGLRMP